MPSAVCNYLASRDAHPEDENVIYRVDNTFSTNDHQEAGTAFLSTLGNMGEKLHWIDESTLEWNGSGTEDDPYQIWNSDEWQLLCTRVNGEVSYYTGKYFKLMADITIEETFSSRPSKQVGHGENVNFRGIFDGNGHTMTINYVDNNDEDYCAPFRYIRNATIKNLHVAGSITKTDNRNAGGLVGTAFGTCHITNCRSSVDIFFDDPGDCSSGGFIGEVGTSSSTDDIYFENCLFAPAQVNIGTDGSKTFARGGDDDVHVSGRNNYYKTLINDAQGCADASNMDNETLYAALGNGWEIVVEDGVEKVVPIMGPRALNGEGTPASPYLIANANDWHALATNVYLGETYSGNGEVTLSKTTGVDFEGWNLVGNPFNDTAYIDRPFYVMNSDGSEIIAAADAEQNSIAPMEGVFVIANQDEVAQIPDEEEQHQDLYPAGWQ